MALTATATPQAYRTVCLAWIILGTHCLCHLACLATRIAVNVSPLRTVSSVSLSSLPRPFPQQSKVGVRR